MAGPLIFIHVPKTGGQSVARYLRISGLNPMLGHHKIEVIENNEGEEPKKIRETAGKRAHRTAAEIKKQMGARGFKAATKFAVVRNPVDRYRSACNYLGLDPNDETAVNEAIKSPMLGSSLLRTQTDMLYVSKKLAVDKLFRFETDVPDGVYEWLQGARLYHFEEAVPSSQQKKAFDNRIDARAGRLG